LWHWGYFCVLVYFLEVLTDSPFLLALAWGVCCGYAVNGGYLEVGFQPCCCALIVHLSLELLQREACAVMLFLA
jgi:hypothetical protein